MGLDYDYKVYLKKERLLGALEYLYANCDKSRTGFEIEKGRLIKLDRYPKEVKRTEIPANAPNYRIDSCLVFKTDQKIVEYYLKQLTQDYQPDTDDKDDYISFYQIDPEHYWIGNIEIHINDYSDKEQGVVEIEFWAVTSEMSLLFAKSESILRFFKTFCEQIEADFGCLYMEDAGYRLIWFEGEEMDLTVPINWSSFQEHGFRTVIKNIFKNRIK